MPPEKQKWRQRVSFRNLKKISCCKVAEVEIQTSEPLSSSLFDSLLDLIAGMLMPLFPLWLSHERRAPLQRAARGLRNAAHL